MTGTSEITELFLAQVKNATIGQLVEADKANLFGKKDESLSAKEIQQAMMNGTLTSKFDKDGNLTSSAIYVSQGDAERIVTEISQIYPEVVLKDGTVNFRQLKAEIDPKYKKFVDAQREALNNPQQLDDMLVKMANQIDKTKLEASSPVRK